MKLLVSWRRCVLSPSGMLWKWQSNFKLSVFVSTEEIREQFFAIATEQRLSTLPLMPLLDAAKGWLNINKKQK